MRRFMVLPFALALPLLWGAGDVNDFPLKGLEAGKLYAVTVSVDQPYRFATGEIDATIADARGPIASKILHAGDLDFYVTMRARAAGNGAVKLNRRGARNVPVSVNLQLIALAGNAPVAVAALPNSTWPEAPEFQLGQTGFGPAAQRAFVPAPSEDAYQALVKGFQWFRFTYRGSAPKLAYFTLDVLDREVPVDLDVFQKGKDAAGREDALPYGDGQFAYVPEATQTFPGL